MVCPFLRRSHPAGCRGVAYGAEPLPREVLAAYCRGGWSTCPGYRYVRASGQLMHPADFRAWVVLGVVPGQIGSSANPPSEPDAA